MNQLPAVNRVLAVLPELYALAEPAAFPARCVAIAGQVVAGDWHTFHDLSPGNVRSAVLQSDPRMTGLLPAFYRHVTRHPLVAHRQTHGNARSVAVSDFVSRAAFARTAIHAEYYRHLSVHDQLSLSINAPAEPTAGLSIYRGRRGFSDADREALDLLRPHMVTARRNAAALDGLLRADAADPRTGLTMAVTRAGRIEHSHPAAVALLRTFAPGRWRADRLPPRLADWFAAAAAVADVRAAYQPLHLPGPAGDLLVRAMADPTGERWLIVLQERRRERAASAEDAARLASLPPRARRVMDLLLAGDGEKTVAGRLGLSPNTVHEYVKILYRHLGVGTRGELLSRWVRP